jgi:1,2-phenylacetyl-CoA epoxidase PaaB subunit
LQILEEVKSKSDVNISLSSSNMIATSDNDNRVLNSGIINRNQADENARDLFKMRERVVSNKGISLVRGALNSESSEKDSLSEELVDAQQSKIPPLKSSTQQNIKVNDPKNLIPLQVGKD